MEKQQQRRLLNSIGGEPLEGSGFENEQSTVEDERVLRVPADQTRGEAL
ncbi:MAG: hypothetical protein ACJ746_27455 [Bryobacteraceae bacterium]